MLSVGVKAGTTHEVKDPHLKGIHGVINHSYYVRASTTGLGVEVSWTPPRIGTPPKVLSRFCYQSTPF